MHMRAAHTHTQTKETQAKVSCNTFINDRRRSSEQPLLLSEGWVYIYTKSKIKRRKRIKHTFLSLVDA